MCCNGISSNKCCNAVNDNVCKHIKIVSVVCHELYFPKKSLLYIICKQMKDANFVCITIIFYRCISLVTWLQTFIFWSVNHNTEVKHFIHKKLDLKSCLSPCNQTMVVFTSIMSSDFANCTRSSTTVIMIRWRFYMYYIMQKKSFFFHLREHTVDQTIRFLNERRDTVRYLPFIISDLSLLKCITYLLH